MPKNYDDLGVKIIKAPNSNTVKGEIEVIMPVGKPEDKRACKLKIHASIDEITQRQEVISVEIQQKQKEMTEKTS